MFLSKFIKLQFKRVDFITCKLYFNETIFEKQPEALTKVITNKNSLQCSDGFTNYHPLRIHIKSSRTYYKKVRGQMFQIYIIPFITTVLKVLQQ